MADAVLLCAFSSNLKIIFRISDVAKFFREKGFHSKNNLIFLMAPTGGVCHREFSKIDHSLEFLCFLNIFPFLDNYR